MWPLWRKVVLLAYLQILRCSRLHSWSVLCGIIKTCNNVIDYVIAACLSCLLLRAHRYIILTNLVQSTIHIIMDRQIKIKWKSNTESERHTSRLMLYFKILFCTFRLDTIKVIKPMPVCIIPLNWILRAVSHSRELFARTIRANIRVVVLAWVFTLTRTRMFARIIRANSSRHSLCQIQFARTTGE